MKTRAKRQKVIGRLNPDELYTTEGALRFGGLGHDQLRKGRRSGVIKQKLCGGRAYYRGRDLIAWILSGGSRQPTNSTDGHDLDEDTIQ